MTEQEKARDWVHYAKASPTEYGRMGALVAALNESPRILALVLKELQIKTVEDALKWCWSAPIADNRWMRDPKTWRGNDSG